MKSKPIEELRARFRGEILTREDAGYDSARRVYNAMIDKRPRWIARCSDVADVIAAVQFAAGQDLPLGRTYLDVLEKAIAAGDGDLDNSAVMREIQRRKL